MQTDLQKINMGSGDLLIGRFSPMLIFMSQYTDLKNESSRQRIVGNGYMPEGQIQSGIGSIPVKRGVFGIDNRIAASGFVSVPRFCRHIFAEPKT